MVGDVFWLSKRRRESSTDRKGPLARWGCPLRRRHFAREVSGRDLAKSLKRVRVEDVYAVCVAWNDPRLWYAQLSNAEKVTFSQGVVKRLLPDGSGEGKGCCGFYRLGSGEGSLRGHRKDALSVAVVEFLRSCGGEAAGLDELAGMDT